ncbi:hypothetical protein AB0O76_39215 [Streptomyces sp. NPDC086554]|uniref:hypothetical protein n=1 Tax=Streptomyces sp. NPDC086554 TaxID=3154864 RepID=UPI00341BD3F6
MAIFMHASLPGVTTDQYDTLNAKLQETPEIFDGCIAHVCVPSSDGLDIYDLWESEQHMQAFTGKLMPVAEGLGMSGPGGQPETVSVHNYWIPGT